MSPEKSGIPDDRFPFHTYYGDFTQIRFDVIMVRPGEIWNTPNMGGNLEYQMIGFYFILTMGTSLRYQWISLGVIQVRPADI